ncbi:MAG TPA: TonB-dependent receptor [Steroidobacteraceae bacterium]|nr:TonB-dependent receptor [Steroidobacteraceae bacterium]
MEQQRRLPRAIRLALGGALGLASGLTGVAGLAQERSGGDRELETVYVTGSRIARTSDFENPAPVVTFDKSDLDKSGYNNLQQLLEEQPFVGNGTFSTRGNNQDSTANGAASVSLRGLGADATLVLVNGRRVAVSAFAESITTSFVDINALPVAAIERLEVLKDGASAVYGADAVAGVVNVILRKDFEGFEVSGGAGGADGYDEYNTSAIWGFNGEDSNVTLILDYFKNSTLKNVERKPLSTADQTARGGPDNRSSRGFPGSFTVDLGGPQAVNLADPDCPAESLSSDGSTCFYDYGPWNLLQPEAERTGLMLLGRQGFGDAVEFFTEFAAQHNRSIAQGAPTPYDAGAFLTVPVTHPNNPFAGAESISIRRYRSVDAGARQWDIESDNLRLVLGLRGKLMDRWDWEVAAQRARSESEQTGDKSMGWVRTDLLQAEINAGRYNPFGGTYNPQEAIDAITTNVIRQGSSDMTAYDAQISGELFDLPAGTVAMATGVEYREESIKDVPDDQFQRGLIFGTEAIQAQASRDSWSAFVEFAIPVLESLELNLAARYDDYSDFGDTTNPKISARWEPIDGLAFRASWGTGFRAPSLAQIGLGPSAESQFFKDTYWCAEQGISSTDCQVLDYTINFTGNPDLDAEESENFNVGVAWRPNDMWQMSADYWDIKQENKIDEEPFGYLYLNFCQVQDSPVCVRNAPLAGDTLGELQSISATFTNIGEQTTNGVDVSVYFRSELMGGDLTLGLDYSRMLEFQKVELNQDGTALIERDLTGEYEYPEDRFVLTGDWGTGDWGVRATVNYIGSFEDAPDVDFDGVLDYDTNDTRKVDAFTTLNLQGRYTGFDGLTIAVGVDNAFDEEPPQAIGDGDTDVYGYVSALHDPRGQFFYGKVTYRF